jgi:hypothetical protein
MDQEEGLPAAVQKSPYHPAVIPGTRPDRRVLHRCIGRARARSGQRFLSLEPIAVAFSAGITLRPGVLRATGEGR